MSDHIVRIFVSFLLLAASQLVLADGDVVKCVVSGKVTYSNKGCGVNNPGKVVEMNHAAGVVSPDRHTVDQTVTKIFSEREAENRRIGSPISASRPEVPSNKAECDNRRQINIEIDRDTLSTTSSYLLEQLRLKKYENNRAIFALKCGQAY